MRWPAIPALISLLGVALSAPAANFADDPPSELATVLVRKAKRAQKAGDLAEAYVYYSQASALQPRNRGLRSQAAKMRVVGAAQIQAATAVIPAVLPDAEGTASGDGVTDGEVRHSGIVSGIPPDLMFDSLTARELSKERQLAAPPKLSADPGRYDWDLNEPARSLFEKIAARYNLQIIFDSDYPQGGPAIRLRLKQADYRSAFDAVQLATNSFVVPVSQRAIMVARDTVPKRNDLEQYIVLTLPVPNIITAQELNEIVQVVRQTTGVEKIGWDTSSDRIVIRDRISRASLAQALVAQLITYHPEVILELELLQVSESDLLNYGFTVTNAIPLVYLSQLKNSITSIPTGVTQLLTFGAGHSLIGIAAAQVQAMFNEATSDSRSLYAARLRTASGLAGTFHVGEKYPLITSGFVNGSTQGGSNPSFGAVPAISFENLGLELKATPRVHGSSEVSMTIEATYEALSGQSAEGIPVIQNTKVNTEFRARNEEWAIIGGVIGSSYSKSSPGFWGLAGIPFLGNLFRQTSIDKSSNSFLIGVRPHILYMGPDELVMQPLRAGTDQHPFTPL